MGIATHGLGRVETYCQRIRAGAIDPGASPVTTPAAPALLRVDGRGGLGPTVALQGLGAAMDAARNAFEIIGTLP